MSINVNFVGRLGADVEVKTNPKSNYQFLSARVAVDDFRSGSKVTSWLNVTGDFTRFKNLYPYLKKGSAIAVFGTEYCDIYTSKTGTTGIDRKVFADRIEFLNLGGPKKSNDSDITEHPLVSDNINCGTIEVPQQALSAVSNSFAPDDDLPF